VHGNIYPVPDTRNPFLGVHFTRSVKGDVYMGPTAIPAFGRGNYGVLSGMDAEAFDIIFREVVLFMVNPGFREVALSEPRKYFLKVFYNEAKRLVKDLEIDDLMPTEKVGIRPQLIDWEAKSLVSDFVIIKDGTSLHILNAVSPAFTGSMDFAERIVKEYVH
jgi:L-2-hydroxyglutarate oxidase LhgO